MMGILQLTILIRSARACSTIITAVMWRVLKIPDTTARAGGEHLDSGQSGTRNPKSGFEFPLPLGFICVTVLKRQNCASCAEMFVLICDVPLFGYICPCTKLSSRCWCYMWPCSVRFFFHHCLSPSRPTLTLIPSPPKIFLGQKTAVSIFW